MAFNLQDLVLPHIQAMKPYSSARDEFRGDGMVFLDANENNLGSVGTSEALNRYPDPIQLPLKEKLAHLNGISEKQIFLGNGSDEAIDLLIRLVCQSQRDSILVQPPTYGMYAVSASLNQTEVQEIPLKPDLSLDVKAIVAAIRAETKIIFLCSPNNPTGVTLAPEQIKDVLIAANCLVVVDEAYIDFSRSPSVINWLDEFPNLVVLRTFSKAWGLAGIRLGAAFASEEIIRYLTKIKPPYNVNILTQRAGLAALDSADEMKEYVNQVISERERLHQQLKKLPAVVEVYPSDANFLLVKFDREVKPIYDTLLAEGVVVRDRSKVLYCENALRFSIGTAEENDKVIDILTDKL
ncbi:MAG: histidinol-phosphate transaminase [Bacteroidota bacterium]